MVQGPTKAEKYSNMPGSNDFCGINEKKKTQKFQQGPEKLIFVK